jgi:hypothetical protein
MRLALETVQRDGASIAHAAEALTKVNDLAATETDTEKAADLERVHKNYVKQLVATLDYFLDDAAPRGFEAGIAHYPGAWPIFLELFAPLQKYKGATSEALALEGATELLKKITWALAHAGDIAIASARQKHPRSRGSSRCEGRTREG